MKKPIKTVAKVAAIGASIGYLAGLLTAKQSGKETREDIANTTKKVKDTAEAKISQLHAELTDTIKQAEAKIKSGKMTIKDGITGASAKAKVAQTKANELIKALKSGKASDKDLAASLKSTKAAIDSLKNYLK
jgi:gas vesicle protein